MKTSRSRRHGFLLYWGGIATLLAILVCGIPRINAQIATTTATLSGVVTDPTGALVPKATVTLASSEKGITRTFLTDDGGRYSFNQLPPAGYSLTIKAKGFKTYQQTGIILEVAETGVQNVMLTVGSEGTSITVTSDIALLNTENANVASDVDAKQIVEMPLNVRNIYGLAVLNSSVQNSSETQQLRGGGSGITDTADQDISFLNFAGGFFGTTGYMVDGSWDTDTEWGAVIFVPNVDAVQEFKIQNNSFTAQYGWSSGNVVNVVTKAGTNAFHGSAFEFWSGNKMNALQYSPNPINCVGTGGENTCAFSRNQFGGTAGGPLYIPGLYKQREKTFIFGVYEKFKANTPSPVSFTVPDTKMLGGDFSEALGAQATDPKSGLPIYDVLGRAVMTGAVYDPRSAHAVVANAQDNWNINTNPYGACGNPIYTQINVASCAVATASGVVRNPVPGNVLSAANIVNGYTPDAFGAKLLSFYPAAQTPGDVANNLTLAASAPTTSQEWGVRVDENFNDNLRGYFRYSYKQEQKVSEADNWGSDPAGPGNVVPNNRWGMWAGLTKVFSPSFTMNITSGVQIWHEDFSDQSFGYNPQTGLGLPAYTAAHAPLFPAVAVGGGFSALGPAPNSPQANTNHGPIGTVAVDLIKLRGKNTFNFGFMGVEQVFSQSNYYPVSMTYNQNFSAGPNPHSLTPNTGNAVAEMLLGTLSAASVQTPFNPYESNHLLGWYVQDDWRPNSKLTLNLGVRYEIQTPYTSRHNEGSIFDPTLMNPVSAMVGQPVIGALQFLGADGSSRYFYNMNYDNIAPRLGFSYAATPKLIAHGGYGIFYPEALTSSGSEDEDGFSATTTATVSQDGGVTPNPNITTNNPWGGVYAQTTGSINGEFQQLGNSVGSGFRSRRSPYVEQWMLGVEYGITPNDQLEVNYIGNRGIRMIGSPYNNQLNPSHLNDTGSYLAGTGTTATATGESYLGGVAVTNPFAASLQQLAKSGNMAFGNCNLQTTPNNTGATAVGVTNAQLLSPFPQYCSVGQVNAPIGQSLYNALQATYNHRVAKGLTALVSYTFSKFLDNVEGNNAWSYNSPGYSAGTVANNYNMAAEKSVDAGDVPQALVASYTYQLPIGRGKAIGGSINRVADAIVGGWQINQIASFKQGTPIKVNSGSGVWSSFGGNPRPDLIGNPKLAHPSTAAWVNAAAFATPTTPGDFGNTPRYFGNVRGPRYQNWDSVLEKNWTFKTNLKAQFRLEAYNTFNHTSLYAPSNTTVGTTGFGSITQAFENRVVQWAGKFYW
ncbi:MAG: carboxypeptidase-like regulatory domain-containing protein [Terracidiphilus sp.]